MTKEKWKQPSKKLVGILEQYGVNGFERPGGTDKNTIHNYTGIYEELLSRFQKKEGQLLEIGVQHGGSSLLWQKYLPKFTICMVDIVDIVNPWIWNCMEQNENDYCFYENNAYDTAFVSELQKEWDGFDVIIDDGPHTLESQVFAVYHYLPLLKENGIFAIEDIQSFEHLDILSKAVPNELKDNIVVYDVRETKGRYDDLIFTVKK